jgi:BclB C-terminal domain-containing protein
VAAKDPQALVCASNGAPQTGAMIGPGISQDGIPLAYPTLTISYENGFTNCAWSIPRESVITDISFYISTDKDYDLGEKSAIIFAQLWESKAPNDTFTPVKDSMVKTQPLSGAIPAGSHTSALLHLPEPYQIPAGTRLLYIVGIQCENENALAFSGLISGGIIIA